MSTILPIGFGHVRHHRQQPVQHVFAPHSASSFSHRSASARSRTKYSGTAGAAGSASTITTTTRSWVNALAWLEQLPHGEAFRAYWTTLEQACQLNLSNKPPSAHARPRGHPRVIRTEPAARLRPGIWLSPGQADCSICLAPSPAWHRPCSGRKGCCHAVHFKL